MRYDVLQSIFRKPIKMAFFILLVAITVAFLSIGTYLFSSVSSGLIEIENIYRTVGTVEQINRTVETEEVYDRILDKYDLRLRPIYENPIDIESLSFEGANYIIPPENRPYYHVTVDNKGFLYSGIFRFTQSPVAEYKIVEQYAGGIYVKAEVVQSLNGVVYHPGDTFYLYQRYGEEKFIWDENKTYISSFTADPAIMRASPSVWNSDFGTWPETMPMTPYLYLSSAQIDSDGKYVDSDKFREIERLGIIEVTDDLYETELGKRLEAMLDGAAIKESEIRTISTNSLGLLMDFYNKNSYLTAGREITQEEFDEGKAVCMIQADMASGNHLEVGDKISLGFMDSVYGYTLGDRQYVTDERINYETSVNVDSEPYEEFFESEYEIVGIYERMTKNKFWASEATDYYAVGYGTIILPTKSITSSDENNMNGDPNLKPYNVSFEIPNGTTKEYMEKVRELGLDENLSFAFYDGGYENIKEGLNDMREMALILLFSGGITSVSVLCFFTFLFIGKEKKSVAVRRSLGVTTKGSMISMLIGVLIVVMVGAGIGTFIGGMTSQSVYNKVLSMTEQSRYDTEFSNWTSTFITEQLEANENPENEQIETEEANANDMLLYVAVFFSVVIAELLISAFFIRNNLRQEPMRLLSLR